MVAPSIYQGYGITAYGPIYQTLMADPDWELVNTTYQGVDAGEQVQPEHHISTTNAPLDGTLHVDGSPEFFWLVSDIVPASVTDGPYEVYVTASDGDSSQTASDIIWVGDWVAPPSGPPAKPIYAVALPVITAE